MKTKIMMTGFAIFAAMLMLMTTSLAGPISESTNMNAVENAQQELIDSMEALFEKIESDSELSNLIEQITNDQTTDRNSRPTSLENTDGINKEALKALNDYFERTYSRDVEGIESQASNLQEELLPDQNTDVLTVSPEILGFLPIYGAIYPVGDVTELSGCSTPAGEPDYIYDFDSGEIYLNGHDITGHVVGDGDANTVDGVEAEWAGFLRNQNDGEVMLVPGLGWVSISEYGWLEDLLQDLPYGDVIDILGDFALQLGTLDPDTDGILWLIIQIIFYAIIDTILLIGTAIVAMMSVIVAAILSFVSGYISILVYMVNNMIEGLENLLDNLIDFYLYIIETLEDILERIKPW